MAPNTELAAKVDRISRWLQGRDAHAALLTAAPNVAWMSCGGELLRADTPVGFVVTAKQCFFLSPSEDVERIRQEEVRGLAVELVAVPALGIETLVARARTLLPPGTRWTSDVPGLGFDHDRSIEQLRRLLLPEEIERLRKLAREAAAVVEEVATECYRGILERDAAARLASECVRRQMTPELILAGADERLEQYTRPLPKSACAEHTLVLGLVARRGGLHVALSRTVCLAEPRAALLERFDTLARLTARLCSEARPGEELGQVVQRALPPKALASSLGGVAGYALPEVEALPESSWKLAAGQVLAWTLATPGILLYETTLLGASGCEPLTVTEDWPRRTIELAGRSHEIPDLLLV